MDRREKGRIKGWVGRKPSWKGILRTLGRKWEVILKRIIED
jgi:hypothetical protein